MEPQYVAIFIAILVQFAGLIWGAAKISSAVAMLTQVVAKLEATVSKLDDRVDDQEVRLRLLDQKVELG